MALRSFFSYYGGKWRTAKLYPKPRYDTIVEPFAGAAGYSLHYPSRKVILYDVNPVIYGLWKYLIEVSEEEIRSLPTKITDLREMKLPQEQKWLIGFWLNKGSTGPRNVPTSWMKGDKYDTMTLGFWGKGVRGTIASQLYRIRHWKVYNKSYEEAPNREATWFIDPPYQSDAGRHYKYHEVDFKKLGRWCRRRRGQVIACDAKGADWLPFGPLDFGGQSTVPTSNGKQKQKNFSVEVLYHRCNEESDLWKLT